MSKKFSKKTEESPRHEAKESKREEAREDAMKGGGSVKNCYAEGGLIRGTGAAVKGKRFCGEF